MTSFTHTLVQQHRKRAAAASLEDPLPKITSPAPKRGRAAVPPLASSRLAAFAPIAIAPFEVAPVSLLISQAKLFLIDQCVNLAAMPQKKTDLPTLGSRASDNDPTSVHGNVESFAFWANSDPKLCNDKEMTAAIKNSMASTADYQKAQARSVARFCGFVNVHPNEKIRMLAEMVPDNELLGQEECRFIVLVCGLKTAAKRSLTNNMLTVFAVNMCKLNMSKEALQIASAQEKSDTKCKPSSLSTYFKHLFACFTLKLSFLSPLVKQFDCHLTTE